MNGGGAAATGSGSARGGTSAGHGSAGSAATVITAEERRAQIDRDLDASIGVFDGRLRKEQQVLANARGSGGSGSSDGVSGSNPAANGAAAGGEGGSPTIGLPTGSSGSGSGKGGGASQSSAGHGKTGSNEGGGAGGGSKGGGGPTAIPADVPDGHDDDIVARQLREAAMKETDAELRDRLWQEYRDYKKNSKG